MNSNTFVCQLSKENQKRIKKTAVKFFIKKGFSREEIKELINSIMENRLWNIEDIMDISDLK